MRLIRKPLSEETKQKISLSLKGHLVSKETRDKIGLATKGRHLSEEVKRKLSEKMRGENSVYFGKHITEETRCKLRLLNLGKKLSAETKRKISLGNIGRVCSEETRKKIGLANSIALKGKHYSKRTKEHCLNLSKSLMGRKLSEESKRKVSETKKSQHLHWSEDHKKKLSVISKKLWNNLDYARRCTNIKENSPNQAEIKLQGLLNSLFPNEYKFVGDNKIRIDSFCPDFVNCNGQKKIIELFGERWHSTPESIKADKRRIETYSKYGYKTLIVWSQELYKNIINLKQILIEFHEKGGVY